MVHLLKPSAVIMIVFCTLLFFACAPQTDSQSYFVENTDDIQTIKKETSLRRSTLEWTEQMKKDAEEVVVETDEEESDLEEESELTKDRKAAMALELEKNGIKQEEKKEKIVEGPAFSEKLKYLTGTKEKSVYPVLPVLGKMDISQISSVIYSKLTEFLTGLKNKTIKSDSSIFAKKFIGVVFLYELDFYPDVSSWYIGAPFISGSSGAGVEDVYEIPVLLISKNGKFMCWISIDASKAFQNEFVINQIVLGDLM